MTSTNGPCGITSPWVTPVAERPRYYPRQIITPDDLMLEQEYFRNKLRRHNRLVHGWGVVCGAQVCLTPQKDSSGNVTNSYQPWTVTVNPGYILGPYGDEIFIDCCRTVDVRTMGASGVTGDPCVQLSDPWCTEVPMQQGGSPTVYIAVKYKECQGRPVRVQPLGCGCNDNTCEYSRLQDGYEIGVLTSCLLDTSNIPSKDSLLQGPTPDCPSCPSAPWVPLAVVTVDTSGNVTNIDNCGCRRIIASFGNFWWQCTSSPVTSIKSVASDPATVPAGTQATATVTFNSAFAATEQPTFDLGPGVTVANSAVVSGTPTQWKLNLNADPTAAPGARELAVKFSTGSVAYPDAITIAPPSQPASAEKKANPASPASGKAKTPATDTAPGSDTTPAGDQKKS